MEGILDVAARRMVGWLWGIPPGVPLDDMDYAQWIQPEGQPVRHKRWRKPLKGRGSQGSVLKRLDEFYHRGAYERHEPHARGPKKISLRFRGKGAKIERRHGKRTRASG